MEHDKHGCVWHPLRPRGRRPHGELDRSRSELTVREWELILTSDLQLGARNHHSYKCGMADATTSRVRGRRLVLRLVHGAIRQAPYPIPRSERPTRHTLNLKH